jgi:glucokinase
VADILVADVGATYTRIAVLTPKGRKRFYHKFESKAYPSLTALLFDFVSRHNIRVSKASIALAGPVREGQSIMPNLAWHVDVKLIKHALKCKTVLLHNDAQAAAVALDQVDFEHVKEGDPEPHGTRLVVGVGTGLGAALAVHDGKRYHAQPTEAGHSDFSPQTANQFALWGWLHKRYAHVSVERCISGSGLVELYRLLREENAALESDAARKAIDAAPDQAKAIMAMGVAETDSLARYTLLNFASMLGGFCGSAALITGATGGVYLYGSLVNAMHRFVDGEFFKTEFERKGRMKRLLANIPVYLVTDEDVVLEGAALLAGIPGSKR